MKKLKIFLVDLIAFGSSGQTRVWLLKSHLSRSLKFVSVLKLTSGFRSERIFAGRSSVKVVQPEVKVPKSRMWRHFQRICCRQTKEDAGDKMFTRRISSVFSCEPVQTSQIHFSFDPEQKASCDIRQQLTSCAFISAPLRHMQTLFHSAADNVAAHNQ